MNTEVGTSSYKENIKTDCDNNGFVSLQSDKVNAFITNDHEKVPEDNKLSEFMKGLLAGNYPTKQEICEVLSSTELYDSQTIIIASLIPTDTYGAFMAMNSEKDGIISFGKIQIYDNVSDIPLLSYLVIDSDCKAVEVYSYGDNSFYSVDISENATADNSYSQMERALKKYLGLTYDPKIVFIAIPFIPVIDPMPSWFYFDFVEEDGKYFMCGYSNTGNYERDVKLAIRRAESELSSDKLHIFTYPSDYESDKSINYIIGNGTFKDLRLEDTYVDYTGGVYVRVSISSDGYDQKTSVIGFIPTSEDTSIYRRNAAAEMANRQMLDAIDKYFGTFSSEPEEDNVVDEWWINPSADTGDIHSEEVVANESDFQASGNMTKENETSIKAYEEASKVFQRLVERGVF